MSCPGLTQPSTLVRIRRSCPLILIFVRRVRSEVSCGKKVTNIIAHVLPVESGGLTVNVDLLIGVGIIATRLDLRDAGLLVFVLTRGNVTSPEDQNFALRALSGDVFGGDKVDYAGDEKSAMCDVQAESNTRVNALRM